MFESRRGHHFVLNNAIALFFRGKLVLWLVFYIKQFAIADDILDIVIKVEDSENLKILRNALRK